jgi:hypothetical protein
MVPLPLAVKAEIVRGGSGKTDYRNQLRNYGGVDVWFIVGYFTGAVKNENTNCKGVGSFLTSVCFEDFLESGLLCDLAGFLILSLTSASNGLMRRCLLRWQDERHSPTFRHR